MSISRRTLIIVLSLVVVLLVLAGVKFSDIPKETSKPDIVYFVDPFSTSISFPTESPSSLPARERLIQYWLSVAQNNVSELASGDEVNLQQLVNHRAALNEMVEDGVLSSKVAGIIQNAYAAAINTIQNNVFIEQAKQAVDEVNLGPTQVIELDSGEALTFERSPEIGVMYWSPTYMRSCGTFLEQLQALEKIRVMNVSDPEVRAPIRTALEQEMAYFSLTNEEKRVLFEKEQEANDFSPEFEATMPEVTPDAKAAAQFIIDLLTGK